MKKKPSATMDKGPLVRGLMATASLLVYALVFLVAYPFLGLFAGFFNLLPVVVFGWLLGVRGGFLYLVTGLTLNLGLFTLARSPNNDLPTHLLGISFYTLVSIGIGWVRDLKALNIRFQNQTVALEKEQKLLQAEIERRTRAEEKLVLEALHDPLTNLPNRRLFFDRLDHAHAWSRRNPESLSAVLYLDLDQFKPVNDSLGHQAGDELLKQVAVRLLAAVRDIDTVARLGGDEFAVLLEAAPSREAIHSILRRIQDCLAQPYELQDRSVVSGASIGAVIGIAAYENWEALLHDADAAMYRSKDRGGNQCTVFGDEDHPSPT